MKVRITGERGIEEKSVVVEVLRDRGNTLTVRHTDGRPAFVNKNGGGSYNRMMGVRYVTLMKNVIVTVLP